MAGIKQKIWGTFDQATGASFVDHVTAGYEFLMRYYSKHDDIYIFGFSRGAYTARFLAEMVHHIGLLSKGNEEMIQFAYETFSKYQQSAGNDPKSKADIATEEYMEKFKNTFARPNVSVHFLGLFDCVNSVGQFEIPLYRTSYKYIAQPAAKHIRHAVSIHERRLKFKPALFLFDDETRKKIDLKEVWFAGNHADVGGGWNLEKGQTHLLSDTPLNWMVQESLNLPGSKSTLSYATTDVKGRAREENQFPEPFIAPGSTAWNVRHDTSKPHDMLKMGHGVSWFATLLWWLFGKFFILQKSQSLQASYDLQKSYHCSLDLNSKVANGCLEDFHRTWAQIETYPATRYFTNRYMRWFKLVYLIRNHTKEATTPIYQTWKTSPMPSVLYARSWLLRMRKGSRNHY